MRLRHVPWAQELLDAHPNYVPQNLPEIKGHWQDCFARQQPIHLEVGSGKGQFIVEMAKAHPEINYIAMEIQTSVAVRILERQLEDPVDNLQILNANGSKISEYFAPGEIDRVYLNFSDPWPKKRHAKRRLTSPEFLKEYQTILPKYGEIHFKTDNRGLFEYSLCSMSQYGMSFVGVWLDLHHSDFEGNIMTEYEEKFSAKGQPIYRLEAVFNLSEDRMI